MKELGCNGIVETLFSKCVLNTFDRHRILYAPSESEKNCELVDILMMKTPDGFQVFLQALQDTGHRDAYRVLCSEVEDPDSPTHDIAVHTAGDGVRDLSETGRGPENMSIMSQDTSPDSAIFQSQPSSSSSSSLMKEMHVHMKLTSTEDRMDKLAEPVDYLGTQLLQTNTKVTEAERKREAKLEEMEKSLKTRQALLVDSSKQMNELRSKIDTTEQ